jgi:chromosomal replication initiation ATPase DnaA
MSERLAGAGSYRTKAVEAFLPSDVNLARQVKLHLCHRYSGRRLREIGEWFGVTESGVSQASRRIQDRQEEDRKLRLLVREIVKKASLSNV